MGAWGAGLFQDDDAADLRDEWLDEYKRTGSAAEASAAVRKAFKSGFKDSDEGPVLTLALATMLWRHGVLDAKTRAEALAVIDKEKGLDRWRDEGERVLRGRLKVYAKIRAGLLEKQPPVKTYKKKPAPKPPGPDHPPLVVGDIFSMATLEGGVAYYRVVDVCDSSEGSRISVQLLDIEPGSPIDVAKLGDVAGTKMRERDNQWVTRLELFGWRTKGVLRKSVIKQAGFSLAASRLRAEEAGPRPVKDPSYSWLKLPQLAQDSFDKMEWKGWKEMIEFYLSISAAEIDNRSAEIESLLRRMRHDDYTVCVPLYRLRIYHGEFARAEAASNIAVRMFPTCGGAFENLGSARWHQGNRAGAEEAWAKAMSHGKGLVRRFIEMGIEKTRAGLDLKLKEKPS